MGCSKEKISVISLDYDGCSDVLKLENVIGIKNIDGKYYPCNAITGSRASIANHHPSLEAAYLQFHRTLVDLLDSAEEGARAVELYVGSNRQNAALELFNMVKNKNGSCFATFGAFVKNKNRSGSMVPWSFRKLLLADVEDSRGNVREPKALDMVLKDKLSGLRDEKHYQCKFDELKTNTILEQLKDVARHHPDTHIEFTFIDDDGKDKIIPALQHAIETAYADPHQQPQLPKHITVKLIKYDYFHALERVYGSAAILGPEHLKALVDAQVKVLWVKTFVQTHFIAEAAEICSAAAISAISTSAEESLAVPKEIPGGRKRKAETSIQVPFGLTSFFKATLRNRMAESAVEQSNICDESATSTPARPEVIGEEDKAALSAS